MSAHESMAVADGMRQAKGDHVLAIMVAVLAFAMPMVALLAPLGLAPLGAVAMVIVMAMTWRDRPWRRLPRVPVILFGLIAVYGVVSTFWAVDPGQTLKTSLRMLVSSLAGLWLVSEGVRAAGEHRSTVLKALAAGLLLCGALLLWEYTTERGFSHLIAAIKGGIVIGLKSPLNRGTTVFALLMWPLALMVRRRWGTWPSLALVAVGTTVILLGDSGSAKLSVILSVALYLAAWWRPQFTFRLVRGGFVALVVVLPMAAAALPSPYKSFDEWTWLPFSAHHRLTIWTFTGTKIAEKPVLGWAMDASRSIPGGDAEIVVVRTKGPEGVPFALSESMLPLHPHNAILQWWLELGLPGAVLLTGFFWWLIGRVGGLSLPAAERATFLAMFGGGMVVSLSSYGFWQSWWQATLWLSALLWATAAARGRQEN